jgi:hypothetical protein
LAIFGFRMFDEVVHEISDQVSRRQSHITKQCTQVFIVRKIAECYYLSPDVFVNLIISLRYQCISFHDDTVLKNAVTCFVELTMRVAHNEGLFEIQEGIHFS